MAGRFALEPDRDDDNAVSLEPEDNRLPDDSPDDYISDRQADAIVAALFRWTVDMPYPKPDRITALSSVACMVIDAYEAEPSLRPLSDAYHRAKRARGIQP